MVEQILKQLDAGVEKSLDSLTKELLKVRTGRANPSLLDSVRVDYYGTMTPLNQISSVSVSDARLILIKPWEKSLLPLIEKAVRDSLPGINPTKDAEVVRVVIPPLTEERRKEISKSVQKMGEEAKVGIRHLRRDAKEELELAKKEGLLPEDDVEQTLKKVQLAVDKGIEKVDGIISKKQAEIMDV